MAIRLSSVVDFYDAENLSQNDYFLVSQKQSNEKYLSRRANLSKFPCADETQNGFMSVADKTKLDSIEDNANNYTLPPATANTLGGIKVGANLTVTDDGLLSARSAEEYELPVAAQNTLGGVKLGYTSSTPTNSCNFALKIHTDDKAYVNVPTFTTAENGYGIVQKPTASVSDNAFLKKDGSWQVPPNTTYKIFDNSNDGLCPKKDDNLTTKFLRQDGTWKVPSYSTVSKDAAGLCPQLPDESTTTKYLRQDGTWKVPPDTKVDESTLIGKIYPVNSIYLDASGADICPIAALISGSTWKLLGNKILTDGSTAPVVGDGKTLGLTDGSYEAGINSYDGILRVPKETIGKNIGTKCSSLGQGTNTLWGVTTDSTKSGLVAELGSATGVAVKIWQRTK